MGNSKKNFCAIFFFYSVIVITNLKKSEKIELTPTLYPSPIANKTGFGFENFFADLYWLRLVQNIDFCESEASNKAVNKGKNLDDILSYELKASRCNKGWVFQMLDTITDLSPKFRRAYRIGAESLSVAVDDREGARIIFDKGVKQFPGYWELSYSAAYHYLFEFQDPEKAAKLLIKAADSGGPYWFKQMAGTLYGRSGKFLLAETTLKTYILGNLGRRSFNQAVYRLKELYIQMGIGEKVAEEKVQSFVDSIQ